MTRSVLVTGATGTLGREVLPAAVAVGHRVRPVSRRDHPGDGELRWRRCDLLTGEGLDDALEGVDVVVHCATQPTGGKDVISTQNLLNAARRAGITHLVYISIVGVDRIPLPYYKTKLRVEQMLAASDVWPHDPAGHPVPRPDRGDLPGTAAVPDAARTARGEFPADRHQRRGRAALSSWQVRHPRKGPLMSADPRSGATLIWRAPFVLGAEAAGPSSRCRYREGSSPAIAPARTWPRRIPSAPFGSRITSADLEGFLGSARPSS